jgi:hypothetical protein
MGLASEHSAPGSWGRMPISACGCPYLTLTFALALSFGIDVDLG